MTLGRPCCREGYRRVRAGAEKEKSKALPCSRPSRLAAHHSSAVDALFDEVLPRLGPRVLVSRHLLSPRTIADRNRPVTTLPTRLPKILAGCPISTQSPSCLHALSRATALAKPRAIRSCRRIPPMIHGSMLLSRYFLPDPEGDAEGGGDRLASADAARRHAPAAGGRHLFLAAARLPRSEEDRADRARGAEPGRGARSADADHPVGRPLARERPLRRLRQGDAAHRRPPRARHALRPDQRGDDHRHLPRLCALVPRPAAQSLPYPVEVPRRGAPALRRHARPRVPDEGRLFLRPRLRGRARTPTTGCSSPICAPSRGWA